MSEGKPTKYRNTQWCKLIPQHINQRPFAGPRLRASNKLADCDTFQTIKAARSTKLGQSAVDKANVLVDIFKQQDRARKIGACPSDGAADHSEIAAH